MSAEGLIARQAAGLMRPLNARLGIWQASSIKLRTMAERGRRDERPDPAVAREAAELLELMNREAATFDAALPSLPPAVTANARVQDTRRSLETIRQRLCETLAMLSDAEGTKPSD